LPDLTSSKALLELLLESVATDIRRFLALTFAVYCS
jgi:hypothetical protein